MVIGVDEVGRGAFAGPVVAAAASLKLPKKLKLLTSISCLGIDDSKKLSPLKREKLVKEIKKYFYWGIGEGSVVEINRLGIVKATEKAMRRAVKQLLYLKKLKLLKTFVLVDAFYVKYIPGVGLKNQKAIIHGDQKSISIAAASILAKVYRDILMQKLALRYGKYHWEKNKGYGTKEHREVIRRYGATKLHRRKFVESWLYPTFLPSIFCQRKRERLRKIKKR